VIAGAHEALRARGLDVRSGPMSTIVTGEPDAVFDGLKASFRSAAELGDAVMVVTVSNCCPTPAASREPQAARKERLE
jgi:uncharacterized protein YqgV (UPF0045/DUF77 family)